MGEYEHASIENAANMMDIRRSTVPILSTSTFRLAVSNSQASGVNLANMPWNSA
jgi:hypothetical protein